MDKFWTNRFNENINQLKYLKEDLDKYGIYFTISKTILMFIKNSPNLYLD